jgi:hypothetical protein
MTNPFDRLQELDQKLGQSRAQLEEVSSRLAALGPPSYANSPDNVSRDPASGEGLSKEVPALTPEEQRQKAELFPDRLELHTSLSTEKYRLEKQVGGLEAERARVKDGVDRIEQLRGELQHVNGQIAEVKAENIEALKAYDDKITSLKNADRDHTIRDVRELKELDATIDTCKERRCELEGQSNSIMVKICDAYLGQPDPALARPDAIATGTMTRDSRLEIGRAEELSKITAHLRDEREEKAVHLGNEVLDATKLTGQHLEQILKNPPSTATVAIREVPKTEFMQITPIKDPQLMLILAAGAVVTVGKEFIKELGKPDPEKGRTLEAEQLKWDRREDMSELYKQLHAERVDLRESQQDRHADKATIERETAKQNGDHSNQVKERMEAWDQKLSDMQQRHQEERTPYEREKWSAPDQVKEKIEKWDRSEERQYLQRQEQQREQQALER